MTNTWPFTVPKPLVLHSISSWTPSVPFTIHVPHTMHCLVSFAAVFWDVTQRSPQRKGCSYPNNIPFHWLSKFQRVTEKVEAIKKEIQDAFQARPGAKRLPCPSDGNDDEISDVQRPLSTNWVKVSRTLPFSNNISTPRAFSFGSQALLPGVNPLCPLKESFHRYKTLVQVIEYFRTFKQHKHC